jgi:hypothetical protein
MTLTIEVITNEIAHAAEWSSFRYTESIGAPDEMSVDVIGFPDDPSGFTAPVQVLFAIPASYFYVTVKLDGNVLFSGLIRTITLAKPTPGAMRYRLTASGWEFLAAKRLVGVPEGVVWELDGEGAPVVPIDGAAFAAPTAAGVRALWTSYWGYLSQIDLTTYVTDVLGPGEASYGMGWSGSDLDGATSDLAAMGSAAAVWYLANDAPAEGSAIAPHLALHFGNIVLPDPGDTGDDLLMGFPMADAPTNLAPYNISDTPDWTTSILAVSLSFVADFSQRSSGVYVRGATGFVATRLPDSPGGTPQGWEISTGGTGWGAGSVSGDTWGEEYLDAPGATSVRHRDAFAAAYLESRSTPAWTGTIVVSGYDGWHKGQAIAVTDADYGFVARWFLIRAVSMVQKDPFAEANEYTLTLGDVLSPSLGYALRAQRLREQRKAIDPVTQFVPWVGDLLLDAGGTAPVVMQAATASGKAQPVAGLGARWHLWINGVLAADPFDTSGLFWLSDATTSTNEAGQVTAKLNAGAGATTADAAAPGADVLL